MEKHAKTEQHLSEEHLQAITGGCQDCVSNKALANFYFRTAARNVTLAQEALQRKGQSQIMEEEKQLHHLTAMSHLNAADENLAKAQTLNDRARARGHL